MAKFVFADDDLHISREITIEAETEKQAQKQSWAMLTEEEKNACGLWACVDEVAVDSAIHADKLADGYSQHGQATAMRLQLQAGGGMKFVLDYIHFATGNGYTTSVGGYSGIFSWWRNTTTPEFWTVCSHTPGEALRLAVVDDFGNLVEVQS